MLMEAAAWGNERRILIKCLSLHFGFSRNQWHKDKLVFLFIVKWAHLLVTKPFNFVNLYNLDGR